MKKVIILAVVLCSGTLAMAQTKRIAHRSHSGTGTFAIIASKDNFGEYKPPMPSAPLLPKADSNAVVKKKVTGQLKAKKTTKFSRKKTKLITK